LLSRPSSGSGLGRAKTRWDLSSDQPMYWSKVMRVASGSDCRHQWLDSDDVQDTGEIVGQHVQGHFGSDTR
jgi:hypothetical protein